MTSPQSKTVRRIALVGPLAAERRTAQSAGYPMDIEKMLPIADVLLLVANAEPGAMLFRYTARREFAGDTWHQSADDALEQATYEYGEALLAWMDVPDDVADPHEFAMRYAAERLNDRGGGW